MLRDRPCLAVTAYGRDSCADLILTRRTGSSITGPSLISDWGATSRTEAFASGESPPRASLHSAPFRALVPCSGVFRIALGIDFDSLESRVLVQMRFQRTVTHDRSLSPGIEFVTQRIPEIPPKKRESGVMPNLPQRHAWGRFKDNPKTAWLHRPTHSETIGVIDTR